VAAGGEEEHRHQDLLSVDEGAKRGKLGATSIGEELEGNGQQEREWSWKG
jgi:hypothetical protein